MTPKQLVARFSALALVVGLPATATAQEISMHMQPGADRMQVSIRSPANGSRVTGASIRLQVASTGFHQSCALAGKPNQEGQGHYHVLIDKSLVNMFCTETALVSMQGIAPGPHTITVVPAQDDHTEIEHNAQSIRIDYQPASPPAAAGNPGITGRPSIRIVSPVAGSEVSGDFDVVVNVTNFTLSCDQMGKPNVAGSGHWHLNLDSMTGPMMGMMTMVGMSCERRFHASVTGLTPGSTHTLIALLADNGHAPLMPAVADRVEVKVK